MTPNLDIGSMSLAQRILLVQKIWDSIAAEEEALEITEPQKDELDRRIASCEADPNAGSSWEEVKRRIRAKK